METHDKISITESQKRKRAITDDDTEWHPFFNSANNERHSRHFMKNSQKNRDEEEFEEEAENKSTTPELTVQSRSKMTRKKAKYFHGHQLESR